MSYGAVHAMDPLEAPDFEQEPRLLSSAQAAQHDRTRLLEKLGQLAAAADAAALRGAWGRFSRVWGVGSRE